jgi:hypothetical protein
MSLLSRLQGLLRIKELEREVDEELRSHVAMRAQDNEAAGMIPEEARYKAQQQFGNATLMKEDAREMDIVRWMETAGQNLRYALRMLRRSPGFTAVAILTLALGIGANVATFTVVHAVLLNPLPFAHPEQLVRAYDDLRGSNTQDVGMSAPELWDLRDKSGVFQEISAAWPVDANLTGGEHPDRVVSGHEHELFHAIGSESATRAGVHGGGFATGVHRRNHYQRWILAPHVWRGPQCLGEENPPGWRSVHDPRSLAAWIPASGKFAGERRGGVRGGGLQRGTISSAAAKGVAHSARHHCAAEA